MKRVINLIIAAIIFFCFYSCKTAKEILPGYKLMAAPNGIDRPGRVYRLDSDNKTDFLVEYVDIELTPKPIAISEQEGMKKLNIESLISFIAPRDANFDFELNEAFKKEASFIFKLKDAQVYKISDKDLEPYYADLLVRLEKSMKLFKLKNPKYFIIREAVTAKEIDIQIDKKVVNDNSIKMQVDKMINGNATSSWSNAKKDEIKVTLKDGLFVLFKPEKINLSSSITGDTKMYFEPASVSDAQLLKIGKEEK